MRFLMLTTFYPPWSFGGDAEVVRQLSQALVTIGHEVTVAHTIAGHRILEGRRSPPSDSTVRIEDGIRVLALDAGLGPVAPLASYLSGRPALLRRRIDRLLREEFDVIHFHNPSLLGAPGLFRSGRALKVMTLHDQWLVCPMNVLLRNKRELCERPACTRCSLAHRRPPQLWRYTGLLARSLEGLDALLAPSRSSAGLHAALRPHVRIELQPNFLYPDPSMRAPTVAADPAVRSPRPYFLYAGRLEPVKGVGRLIAVFARRPGVDLVIAGKGSLGPQLQRQAQGLANVRFTGLLTQAELDPLYRDALAVLMPTVGQESCPLVLLEAQARGIPVLCSHHGALGELIDESGGGLTFRDERELDDVLTTVAQDPLLRARLGERGRRMYLRSWTREVHLERYLAVLAELAAARGAHALAAQAAARSVAGQRTE